MPDRACLAALVFMACPSFLGVGLPHRVLDWGRRWHAAPLGAKDARQVADQARMRRDFAALTPPDELLAELGLLVAERRDLQADRVRLIGRLREHLVAVLPALERAVQVTRKGSLLLCGWQTQARSTALG